MLDRARSTLQETGGEICFGGRERRVRGLTLLAEGREGDAEASLREALVFTTRHGARVDSLLCALELARLARNRSDAEAERSRLQALYAEFDQGLETRPLRRVRELLDELG